MTTDSAHPRTAPIATQGPVKVVGTGLVGASIGLGLATRGVPVQLTDSSPAALAVAEQVGAGVAYRVATDPEPALVVVAVPPDVTAAVVAEQLRIHPDAVVTDVASVKGTVLTQLRRVDADLSRYVGSHPMAGRERSGPAAAQVDLFVGRPWVICDSGHCHPDAVLAIRALAVDLGAAITLMAAGEHDEAVALVSHVPQLAASLVAARLASAAPGELSLAGQGLRDVTRIAASDPQLWSTILVANAAQVVAILRDLRDDLDGIVGGFEAALAGRHGEGLVALASLLASGNAGVERIPGKHGGVHREWETLTVLVPDEPGQLGRLFAEAGSIGINVEDLHMEHSPGQPVGLVTISVLPGTGERAKTALGDLGWRVVS